MITSKAPEVHQFWLESCKTHKIDSKSKYHASTFTDPKFTNIGDGISYLALYGQKRATAHLLQDFEQNGTPRRASGDYWVLLSVSGLPMALLRMTKVEVKPFNQVDAAFAATEGEADLSLDHWTKVHRSYFQTQCEAWGIKWSEDLPTVCESFELIAIAPPPESIKR